MLPADEQKAMVPRRGLVLPMLALTGLLALPAAGGALHGPEIAKERKVGRFPAGPEWVVGPVSPSAPHPGSGPQSPGPQPLERRLFPGRTYDASIPSPTEALGYGPGEYHTRYSGMVRYFETLAARSGRLRFDTYGTSYEHRPLYVAFVSSEANLRRLDEIRDRLDRLAHPAGLDEAEAEAILSSTPAGVLLNYGTHGDETAAFEAAMHSAWQLVAATDAETVAMLDELLVIITPALNPDGHERFVAWYNANQVGPEGSADPNAAEHFAPWGVSTTNNHYQVNLNREAAWSTQVEEQAMVRLYMEWNPQVFVDHHGNPEEFIGPWNAEPLHPEITPNQRDWMVRYGEDMAALFRDQGFRYTPWEFGLMYPGYWDSFPLLTGAIAFTLESGGGGWKGLSYRTAGGHVTTFEDGVVQHVLADQSVLRVTARGREEKLRDFLAYKRSAIEEGAAQPVQAYALSAANDPARLEAVVNLLLRNDVEVLRTTEEIEVGGAIPYASNPVAETRTDTDVAGAITSGGSVDRADVGQGRGDDRARGRSSNGGQERATGGAVRLPPGSYLLPMAQPQARLLRALMAPDTDFPSGFLARVEENRRLAERPGFLNPNIWTTTEPFYDVTAWSIPLTYHLEAWQLTAMPGDGTEPVDDAVATPGRFDNPRARHAFLLGYDSNRAIAAIGWLRRNSVGFHVATAPFRIGERRFGPGSVVVYRHENQDVELNAMMRRMVEETGVTLLGVDRNLTDDGPALGSDQFVEAVTGRIGVVLGGPVRPSSWGEIWFLMERVYGVDFVALWFDDLLDVDLRDYGVLVFPDGFYSDIAPGFQQELDRRLRRWVAEGGALVALKGAAAWAARPEAGLTAVRTGAPYLGKSIYMTDGGHPPLPPPYEEPADAAGTGSTRNAAGRAVGDAATVPSAVSTEASAGQAASAEQQTVQTIPMIHGAILRARVWPRHWLSYGYEGEVPVMMWSNLTFTTPPEVAVPVYFVEADRMLMAGFAFPDSLARLAGTGYVLDEPLGLGHVILFADDPNFRLFWDGLSRLFFNAVLLSNTF